LRCSSGRALLGHADEYFRECLAVGASYFDRPGGPFAVPTVFQVLGDDLRKLASGLTVEEIVPAIVVKGLNSLP
jgi:hypothetical protein